MNQESWDNERKPEEINIKQITDLVTQLQEAKKDYDAKKDESSNAEKFYKGLRMDVLSILKAAGQSKFSVDGVGSVSIIDKLSVTTPKSHEDKKLLLDYFSEQGEDVYLTYASVNSNSLNSFYNLQVEEAAKNGELFELPGVGAPTLMQNISFRKG